MPLFGGYCRECESAVYFWVGDLGGHTIESASLVLHPEQPFGGGLINSIWDVSDLTGVTVFGLPARRGIERHSSRPRIRGVLNSITLRSGETIDLTQSASGDEEGHP